MLFFPGESPHDLPFGFSKIEECLAPGAQHHPPSWVESDSDGDLPEHHDGEVAWIPLALSRCLVWFAMVLLTVG